VALWNSNTNQPGGLEFEVMDQIYHLGFHDWLHIAGASEAKAEEESDDSGDSDIRGHRR
jgi:beta-lactamase class C